MTEDNLDKGVDRFYTRFNYKEDTFKSHTESSYNLVDEINALDPKLVIDVGCGGNHLKGKIQNLIGVDAAKYEKADIQATHDELPNIFKDNCADVVLALGSINVGDKPRIYRHLEKVINLCKPGGIIVMRNRLAGEEATVFPEGKQNFKHELGIHWYPWTLDEIHQATETFKNRVEYYKEPVYERAMHKVHWSGLKNKRMLLGVYWWKKL